MHRFWGPSAWVARWLVNGLGAGDAFVAAVGYGLLAGRGPLELLRLGHAAGAFVAAQLVCREAMPRPVDLPGL